MVDVHAPCTTEECDVGEKRREKNCGSVMSVIALDDKSLIGEKFFYLIRSFNVQGFQRGETRKYVSRKN